MLAEYTLASCMKYFVMCICRPGNLLDIALFQVTTYVVHVPRVVTQYENTMMILFFFFSILAKLLA